MTHIHYQPFNKVISLDALQIWFICGFNIDLMAQWIWKAFEADIRDVYLLLPQDEQALWFDGMIWSQILPAAPLDSILESFPNTIASGPGYADMMPLPVIDEERQLCHLEEQRSYVLQ